MLPFIERVRKAENEVDLISDPTAAVGLRQTRPDDVGPSQPCLPHEAICCCRSVGSLASMIGAEHSAQLRQPGTVECVGAHGEPTLNSASASARARRASVFACDELLSSCLLLIMTNGAVLLQGASLRRFGQGGSVHNRRHCPLKSGSLWSQWQGRCTARHRRARAPRLPACL